MVFFFGNEIHFPKHYFRYLCWFSGVFGYLLRLQQRGLFRLLVILDLDNPNFNNDRTLRPPLKARLVDGSTQTADQSKAWKPMMSIIRLLLLMYLYLYDLWWWWWWLYVYINLNLCVTSRRVKSRRKKLAWSSFSWHVFGHQMELCNLFHMSVDY